MDDDDENLCTWKFFYTTPFLGEKHPFSKENAPLLRENNLLIRETPFSIRWPITVFWLGGGAHVLGEKLPHLKVNRALAFSGSGL